MTDLKISEFADGSLVQTTDEIAAVRSGGNVKVSFGDAAAKDVGVAIGDIAEVTDDGTGSPELLMPNIDTTNPNDWSKQQYNTPDVLTADSSDEVDWDLDDAQTAKLILTGDFTLNNPTNFKGGATYILEVVQDGTGGHSLTFDTMYIMPLSFTPVVMQAANETTLFSFYCNADEDKMLTNYNFYN